MQRRRRVATVRSVWSGPLVIDLRVLAATRRRLQLERRRAAEQQLAAQLHAADDLAQRLGFRIKLREL